MGDSIGFQSCLFKWNVIPAKLLRLTRSLILVHFDCLFHGDIARAIGIGDITSGELKISGGVVQGEQMNTYGHDVQLMIGADSFKIRGFFSDALPIACLLGRNGFFDRFIVTFDPSDPPGFELKRFHKR